MVKKKPARGTTLHRRQIRVKSRAKKYASSLSAVLQASNSKGVFMNRFVSVSAVAIAAVFAVPAFADEMPPDATPPPAEGTAMPPPAAAGSASGMFSAVTTDDDFGDVIGNIVVTSEYLYRGLPQSRGAAAPGNLDWNLPWGLLAGAWISNNESVGGNEARGYLNWGMELMSALRIDLG